LRFLKLAASEVVVVTDHGWLLVPGGLPKVELKSLFWPEHRCGRCAALKSRPKTSALAFKWQWNPEVTIASRRVLRCFRASIEVIPMAACHSRKCDTDASREGRHPAGGSARLLEGQVDRARDGRNLDRWKLCRRPRGCSHQPIRPEHFTTGGQAGARAYTRRKVTRVPRRRIRYRQNAADRFAGYFEAGDSFAIHHTWKMTL